MDFPSGLENLEAKMAQLDRKIQGIRRSSRPRDDEGSVSMHKLKTVEPPGSSLIYSWPSADDGYTRSKSNASLHHRNVNSGDNLETELGETIEKYRALRVTKHISSITSFCRARSDENAIEVLQKVAENSGFLRCFGHFCLANVVGVTASRRFEVERNAESIGRSQGNGKVPCLTCFGLHLTAFFELAGGKEFLSANKIIKVALNQRVGQTMANYYKTATSMKNRHREHFKDKRVASVACFTLRRMGKVFRETSSNVVVPGKID
ncbi:hypothetical protein WN51_10912 [Melipona quadrifasciata]|uniref:Uncharacterized protein n=1 Tax=Melipona quadrifasciata TaxID=166423 RepID=A0A0M9A682_9HYME|nr:hypothetical protein WN51_10912 [Melipona quadrifasciata]